MKTLHTNYCNSKQGYLPLFLSDCLDLPDPVLTFDRLIGWIDLNKYLTDIPEYTTGRLRYNPVNMLKTVVFEFMTSGYCSLREPEAVKPEVLLVSIGHNLYKYQKKRWETELPHRFKKEFLWGRGSALFSRIISVSYAQ